MFPLPVAPCALQRIPTDPIKDFPEFARVIRHCHNSSKGQDEAPYEPTTELTALENALADEGVCCGTPFFGEGGVLHSVQKSAHQLATLFPSKGISTLTQNVVGSVELSAQQIHSVLSHALFCNLGRIPLPILREGEPRPTKTLPHFGSLSLMLVYKSRSRTGMERVKCLISYFHSTMASVPMGVISFERLVQSSPPDWKSYSNVPLGDVCFSTTTIEDSPASIHIDFANEDLHVGAVWPTATQEELLFSIRPELFVGVLFHETMLDNEAIVMRGSRRFCNYSGYQDTFRFTGAVSPLNQPDTVVVAIDAIVSDGLADQVVRHRLFRDLNKAVLGFSVPASDTHISSGMWGCGAFGGDYQLKFAQQLLAASVAKKTLHFSSPGNQGMLDTLSRLLQCISDRSSNVAEACDLLLAYSGHVLANGDVSLLQYLTSCA